MQPASAIADGGDFRVGIFLVGCLPGGKWIWRCRPHCGGQGARVSYKGTGGFVAPLLVLQPPPRNEGVNLGQTYAAVFARPFFG